jgi:hypothetical protein
LAQTSVQFMLSRPGSYEQCWCYRPTYETISAIKPALMTWKPFRLYLADSSASIVLGYSLNDWSSIVGKGKIFFAASKPVLGPTDPPFQ